MPPVGKIIYIYKASGSFNAKEIPRHRDPKEQYLYNSAYYLEFTGKNKDQICCIFLSYFHVLITIVHISLEKYQAS